MAYQTFTVNQQLTSTQMNTLQSSVYILPKNQQSGTTYTLVVTDAGNLLEFTNNAAITLTIPTEASVAFEVGTSISILKAGTGTVTLVGAGGVTINSLNADNTVSKRWEVGVLTKRDTDNWVLSSFEDLIDLSVTTAKLADSAVTTAKIADGAITAGKLAAGAIAGIANGSILSAMLEDGAVTQAKLGTGTPQAGFRSSGAGSPVTLSSNNYDIVVGDLGKLLEIAPSANTTVTITAANDANFAVGDRVDILQTTATHVVTITGSGVTVNAFDGGLKLSGQFAAATLVKRAATFWVAVGNLTT